MKLLRLVRKMIYGYHPPDRMRNIIFLDVGNYFSGIFANYHHNCIELLATVNKNTVEDSPREHRADETGPGRNSV